MTDSNIYEWKTQAHTPLLPEGEYTFMCLGHQKRKNRVGSDKFVLKMQIQGGVYDGIILLKHYGIRGITSEGRIIVGEMSDLLRQYYAVTDAPRLDRLDRMPMSAFNGLLIRASVITVKKDWNRDELPKQSHYSRVHKLLRKIT